MKLRRLLLVILLLSMLFLSGCATRGPGSETIGMITKFVQSWGSAIQSGNNTGITLVRIIMFTILMAVIYGVTSTNQHLSNMLTKSQRLLIALALSLLTVLSIKKSFVILLMTAYSNFAVIGFFLIVLVPSLILFFGFNADEPWKKVLKIILAFWCGALCVMIGGSILLLTTYGTIKSVGAGFSVLLLIPRRWLKCFSK